MDEGGFIQIVCSRSKSKRDMEYIKNLQNISSITILSDLTDSTDLCINYKDIPEIINTHSNVEELQIPLIIDLDILLSLKNLKYLTLSSVKGERFDENTAMDVSKIINANQLIYFGAQSNKYILIKVELTHEILCSSIGDNKSIQTLEIFSKSDLSFLKQNKTLSSLIISGKR
jgi:hypothetical protein